MKNFSEIREELKKEIEELEKIRDGHISILDNFSTELSDKYKELRKVDDALFDEDYKEVVKYLVIDGIYFIDDYEKISYHYTKCKAHIYIGNNEFVTYKFRDDDCERHVAVDITYADRIVLDDLKRAIKLTSNELQLRIKNHLKD